MSEVPTCLKYKSVWFPKIWCDGLRCSILFTYFCLFSNFCLFCAHFYIEIQWSSYRSSDIILPVQIPVCRYVHNLYDIHAAENVITDFIKIVRLTVQFCSNFRNISFHFRSSLRHNQKYYSHKVIFLCDYSMFNRRNIGVKMGVTSCKL